MVGGRAGRAKCEVVEGFRGPTSHIVDNKAEDLESKLHLPSEGREV